MAKPQIKVHWFSERAATTTSYKRTLDEMPLKGAVQFWVTEWWICYFMGTLVSISSHPMGRDLPGSVLSGLELSAPCWQILIITIYFYHYMPMKKVFQLCFNPSDTLVATVNMLLRVFCAFFPLQLSMVHNDDWHVCLALCLSTNNNKVSHW